MKEQTFKLILPTRWGSYFVNGDASGIDTDDKREADACLAWIRSDLCGGANFWCVDCGNEEGFRWANDWNGIGDETARFTFRFLRPVDIWREVWREMRRNGRGGEFVNWRSEWTPIARNCLCIRSTWSEPLPSIGQRLESWKAKKHNLEAMK
jgi:hypothetical protein